MKSTIKFFIGLVFTSVLILNITGCSARKEDPESKIEVVEDTVSVVTANVEQSQLLIRKVYTGTLEGEQQANVVSQLSERIVEIPYGMGAYVKAGQVVIKLDKGGVTSQYYQALSALKNVEKDLARMKSLFESGAVSQQALDGVQTQYDITKANFDAASRSVDIIAPISGVITAKRFEVGDFTAPGMPVLTIANTGSLKAIFSVGEADMPFVKNGQPIKIFSELNPDISAAGKVNEIASLADINTRTFEVKALFRNNGTWFKPGMFVNAELELSTPGKQNVVPRESIIYNDKGSIVYVVKDGKAYSRNVKLGLQNESQVVVTQGLEPGEVIARVGMNNLKDGSPVTISGDSHLLSTK